MQYLDIYDVSADVTPRAIERNKRIAIEWPGYSGPTTACSSHSLRSGLLPVVRGPGHLQRRVCLLRGQLDASAMVALSSATAMGTSGVAMPPNPTMRPDVGSVKW